MKKLSEAVLVIGDIILTTSNHPFSKGIRVTTKCDISHALIYVQPYSVIDSTGDGVHSRNTQRLFYPDNCMIHVMRLKVPISAKRMKLVVDYARGCVGTEYSVKEAVKSVTGPKQEKTKKQFCSRLIARAYAQASVNFIPNVDYCRPDHLLKSHLLFEVEDAVRNATQEEKDQIDAIPNIPQMTMDATNHILKGARTLDPSIQCLSDLDEHLMRHPDADSFVIELYSDSGYLTLWYVEKCKNEYRYDLGLFEAIHASEKQKREYCVQTVDDFDNMIRRFEVNRAGYQKYFNEHRILTFFILYELYEKLYSLEITRYEVAREWLEMHSLLS